MAPFLVTVSFWVGPCSKMVPYLYSDRSVEPVLVIVTLTTPLATAVMATVRGEARFSIGEEYMTEEKAAIASRKLLKETILLSIQQDNRTW